MNERIQELRNQAGIWASGQLPFTNPEWTELRDEKFAELIIQEFEIVAKRPPHYYDAASCGWRNPINYVCKSVKEHFGVEE